MKIEQLKKGEVFRFPNQRTIYVFNGFCRVNRKYEYYKFDDVDSYGYRRKGTLVDTNFEF